MTNSGQESIFFGAHLFIALRFVHEGIGGKETKQHRRQQWGTDIPPLPETDTP